MGPSFACLPVMGNDSLLLRFRACSTKSGVSLGQSTAAAPSYHTSALRARCSTLLLYQCCTCQVQYAPIILVLCMPGVVPSQYYANAVHARCSTIERGPYFKCYDTRILLQLNDAFETWYICTYRFCAVPGMNVLGIVYCLLSIDCRVLPKQRTYEQAVDQVLKIEIQAFFCATDKKPRYGVISDQCFDAVACEGSTQVDPAGSVAVLERGLPGRFIGPAKGCRGL